MNNNNKKQAQSFDMSIDDSIEMYEDAVLASRDHLDKLGLSRCSRPRKDNGKFFDGHLPTGINKAPLSEISEIMTLMTVFADYVQGLSKDAKAEKDAAEEKLKFIKAKIRKTKAGAKSEQDDATITDIRYVSANAEYLEKLHSYEAITAREEAARRDIKTLSRLISTEQINNDTGRLSNVSSRNSTRGTKRWK